MMCVPGYVCLVRGVWLGVSAGEGVSVPLWTEFLTHTCENITFPFADGNNLLVPTAKKICPRELKNYEQHINERLQVYHLLKYNDGQILYQDPKSTISASFN